MNAREQEMERVLRECLEAELDLGGSTARIRRIKNALAMPASIPARTWPCGCNCHDHAKIPELVAAGATEHADCEECRRVCEEERQKIEDGGMEFYAREVASQVREAAALVAGKICRRRSINACAEEVERAIRGVPIDIDELAPFRPIPGHTNHCAARIQWGDGECECGAQPRSEP